MICRPPFSMEMQHTTEPRRSVVCVYAAGLSAGRLGCVRGSPVGDAELWCFCPACRTYEITTNSWDVVMSRPPTHGVQAPYPRPIFPPYPRPLISFFFGYPRPKFRFFAAAPAHLTPPPAHFTSKAPSPRPYPSAKNCANWMRASCWFLCLKKIGHYIWRRVYENVVCEMSALWARPQCLISRYDMETL